MNALAHCAEALYVRNRNEDSDGHALAGAALISSALPAVVRDGSSPEARRRLLEGACEAGAALAGSGLALGHALAQALGGRYGAPHGALNAICLPPALEFNRTVAQPEIARFGEALDTEEPIARVHELARLGGFERLRDLGIPGDELELVAEATSARPAMRQNPRPASVEELTELLRSIW
jgi:alcohol dehydrogenase